MRQRSFESCDSAEDISSFHTLAQHLIPVEIASLATLTAVQAKTGSSIYLKREHGAPTGFLAFFGFSPEGEQAVRSGQFSGVRARPEWVCEATPQTTLGYVWGFGGLSRAACFGVIRAGRVMRDTFFPHLGVFARAATADGRKVMTPLGYRQAFPEDAGLFYSPPFSLTQLELAS